MKELINLARGFSQQFECALVYGIANVNQLDNLFKVNAKRFVIVEADPNVFSKLEEWHSTLPESAPTVSCYHSAITQEDGPTTLLYQASQPGFSSTAKPNQIKRFRPGLTFSSVSVPAKKLSYFTDKYAVSANQHNIALFNCNGAEHQILSDSTSQLFSTIVVKTCSKALFGENTQLPAALTDTGYSQVKIKSAQPPMTNTVFCKPPLLVEQTSTFKTVTKEVEQYKQQVSDLISQNESITDQLNSVNTELQNTQKQLQQKLEAETARAKTMLDENAQISTQIATLTSENTTLQHEKIVAKEKLEGLTKQLVSANDALHKAEKSKREAQEQAKKLEEKLTQSETSLAAVQQERDKQKEHHFNNKQWAENLQEKATELEAQLVTCNEALKSETSRRQSLEKANKQLAFNQEKLDIDLVKVETQVSMFKELLFNNNNTDSE